MEQWRIQKDRTKCDKPGCTLAADPEFYAILQLPDCVRIERCLTCFNEISAANDNLPFHWLVRRKDGANRQPVLDLESLRRLFDRHGEPVADEDLEAEVAEETDQAEEAEGVEAAAARQAGLRYLVALLLLRKRRLKMVDARNEFEERADLVVIDPKVEEMEPVALFAPDLDDDKLDELRAELMVAIGEESEAGAANES